MQPTILVPLDGSLLAEHALPYAEALAEVAGARVALVEAAAVHFTPAAALEDFAGAMRRAARTTLPAMARGEGHAPQRQVIAEAEAYLREVAAVLAVRGAEPETAVVPGGAVETLANEIRMREPWLVAMATHGRSGLDRWLNGSVAQGVLHRSDVPVLLIQSWLGEHVRRRLARRPALLVPLDGSAFAEAALPAATRLAQALGGGIRLVQAVPLPEDVVVGQGADGAPGRAEALLAEAAEYLGAVQARLARAEPALAVRTEVRRGLPAEAIAAATRDESVGLVVMSTHGRSGLGRVLFGSVAEGVLRDGSVPVVMVRPAPLHLEERPAVAAHA